MEPYDKLVNKEETLALVGLGYVGMPIAHAFAKKGIDVIGFDLNREKIELYKAGIHTIYNFICINIHTVKYHS